MSKKCSMSKATLSVMPAEENQYKVIEVGEADYYTWFYGTQKECEKYIESNIEDILG